MNANIIPIKPVSKDLLYMKVADAIHNYIHDNKLQPGDKIPSERVLAEQLGASRNSVREALRVLENEVLIEVKTGRGAFVADNSSPGSIYPKLFKGNYFELLEIKAILEREVLRKTIDKATPEQLAQMNDILKKIERNAAMGIYDEENDKRFHRKMLRICGNMSLEQIISHLIDVLSNYAALLENADEIFISTIPYHRIMLDAMKRRDTYAAYEAYDKILEIDLTGLEMLESEKNIVVRVGDCGSGPQ